MKTVTIGKPLMGILMILLTIALFGCQDQVEEPLFTESDQMADMPLSRSTSRRPSVSSRRGFVLR